MLRNSRTCQGIAFNNLGKCTWKTLDKEIFFLVLFQKKKILVNILSIMWAKRGYGHQTEPTNYGYEQKHTVDGCEILHQKKKVVNIPLFCWGFNHPCRITHFLGMLGAESSGYNPQQERNTKRPCQNIQQQERKNNSKNRDIDTVFSKFGTIKQNAWGTSRV